jgi:hypothetical protein
MLVEGYSKMPAEGDRRGNINGAGRQLTEKLTAGQGWKEGERKFFN